MDICNSEGLANALPDTKVEIFRKRRKGVCHRPPLTGKSVKTLISHKFYVRLWYLPAGSVSSSRSCCVDLPPLDHSCSQHFTSIENSYRLSLNIFLNPYLSTIFSVSWPLLCIFPIQWCWRYSLPWFHPFFKWLFFPLQTEIINIFRSQLRIYLTLIMIKTSPGPTNKRNIKIKIYSTINLEKKLTKTTELVNQFGLKKQEIR